MHTLTFCGKSLLLALVFVGWHVWTGAEADSSVPTDALRVFDVGEFSAVPGPSKDAGPGIRAAISAAKAYPGPAVVHLGPGEYRVAPAANEKTAVPIHDVTDLTLEGSGEATRLVVVDPRVNAIRVQNCQNVRVADLSIDYDPLPFTQGTVLRVTGDALSFEWQCDPGYLEPVARAFAEAQPWGLVVSPALSGGERFGPIPLMGGVWSKTTGGNWRCSVEDVKALQAAGVHPGARYVYMARTTSTSAVAVWACMDVELDGITIHAAPSLATLWGLNENVTIRGLHVKRPSGSNRLLSTNADGIHCLGNRGRLLIENCSFEAMADDAINIHARASSVLEQLTPDRLLVNEGGCVVHRAGDRLQLYDPAHGSVRSESLTVTEVERTPRGAILSVDMPVEGIDTGSTFQDSDHLFNLNACAAGAIIRNNAFGSHRGRGILLKSTDCRIEGNTFRNREGWGIAFHQLQDWGEGPAAQRVLIRDNTFEGTAPSGHASCIDIRPSKRGNTPAEGRPVRDVRIVNNRFINPGNGILSAWAVAGLDLVDNHVVMKVGSRARAGALVSLHEGAGFRIQGLHVSGASARTTSVVLIDRGVDTGLEGAIVEGVVADLRTAVPLIEDKRP